MKKAGLLESTRRGYFKIAARGKELLGKKPKVINVKLLKQYPEFLAFQQLKGTRTGEKKDAAAAVEAATATPSEALENAYENLRADRRKILLIRGQKIMLDADLAALYGVSTKRLNEQV